MLPLLVALMEEQRMRLRAVLSCTIVLLLAVACDGGEQAGQGGQGGEQVELTVGIWNDAQRPSLEKVLEEFHADQQGIRASIEVTPFDLYWQKLEAAATGGVAPDVFWMNAPNVARYAEGEVILPLSDQVESGGIDLGDYADTIVEMYTLEDQLWAMPRDLDVIGLWYNQAMFDAAGVEPPDDSWTWDDVRAAAEELTDDKSRVWGIAADFNAHQSYWNTIYQAGGWILSEDRTESGWHLPETRNGLQYWIDFIEEGWSPTLAQMTDTDPRSMLESEKVAMWYGGSWHALQFSQNEQMGDKLNVAPLPAGEREAVILHGLGYAISANSEHPEEAWELVTFLTSEAAAEIEGGDGNIIPARKDSHHLWVEAYPDFDLAPLLEQTGHAVPYPVSATSPEWFTIMEEQLRPAWEGSKSVEDATAALKQEMDSILAGE